MHEMIHLERKKVLVKIRTWKANELMPATILRSLPALAWPEGCRGAAKDAAGAAPMLGETCAFIALPNIYGTFGTLLPQ